MATCTALYCFTWPFWSNLARTSHKQPKQRLKMRCAENSLFLSLQVGGTLMHFNSAGSSCKSKRWRGPFQVGCSSGVCVMKRNLAGNGRKKEGRRWGRICPAGRHKSLNDLISSDASLCVLAMRDGFGWMMFQVGLIFTSLPGWCTTCQKGTWPTWSGEALRISWDQFLEVSLLDCFLLSLSWWNLTRLFRFVTTPQYRRSSWQLHQSLSPDGLTAAWPENSPTHKGSLWPWLKPLYVHV